MVGAVRPLAGSEGTEKEKSPGDLLQIEGEILTSHVGGWDAGDDVLRAHDFGGGPGGQLRHSGIVEDRGSAPGDGAVRTGAEYGSRCLGHLTDAPGGVLPQTVLQSADGPLQHYLVRDDVILVAPLDPADGQDQGASGADLPGGDGLEGQNDVDGRIDGVYPFSGVEHGSRAPGPGW